MSSFNKVILCGNVGKQPESRHAASGAQVVTLTLATSSKRKDASGERIEETQWHRLVAFNKLAETVEAYVNVGDRILVEGRITYREYTDKEGAKRNTTEIVLDGLQMLTPKPRGDAPPARPSRPPSPPPTPQRAAAPATSFDDLDDDIPF